MVGMGESLVENMSSESTQSSSSGGDGEGPSSNLKAIVPCYEPYKKLSLEELIASLSDDYKRGNSLILLCKIRVNHEEYLGPMLWNSHGTIFALLKDIMQIYYFLSTPHLTERMANQVCNGLALLQCVASHPETRTDFIRANLAEYLYPFITTTERERPYEYLRVTSLGVIGSLVKEDDIEAVAYLLEAEIIPKCMLCLEVGNLLTKTVAAFILERILTVGEIGLRYCCGTAERFFSLTRILAQRIDEMVDEPCPRLLKHIICIYIRLADDPRGCDSLEWYLPGRFTDAAFLRLIQDNPTIMALVHALVHNVSTGHRTRKIQPTWKPFDRSNKGKQVVEPPMLPWDQ
ncbi:Rcd1/Caf [Trema orientale]|uniref:Rcd1/Caf n=1 Tax=Trema orientale TaxID=63057 RepID=A0A2P5EG72_TREOI|nr:Rcd1/Caf [Trema orientale]